MAGSIRVSLPDNESMAGAEDDSGGSIGGSPARPRPQKRRRIPVACGACRSKKSRVRPVSPTWDPIQAELPAMLTNRGLPLGFRMSADLSAAVRWLSAEMLDLPDPEY